MDPAKAFNLYRQIDEVELTESIYYIVDHFFLFSG